MDETKTLKDKIADAKISAKWKIDDFKIWCSNHRSEIVVFGPIIISSTVEIAKILTKRHNVNEEKRLKDNYIYDRSAGHYFELKRKLKSSEWLMIEQRKKEGESLGEILQAMKVLK